MEDEGGPGIWGDQQPEGQENGQVGARAQKPNVLLYSVVYCGSCLYPSYSDVSSSQLARPNSP